MWIDTFLTYLESECNRSKNTLATYQTCLEQFEQYLKDKDEALNWATVDKDVVRDWMVELMEQGENPRTVCKKLSALKTFYKYLLQRELVNTDPVHTLQGPKKEKPLPVFVRESEMDNLLDGNFFSDDLKGRIDRLVLLILYSTGIRLSELVGLDWSDIDLGQRQLKVTGKRDKQRIIPFGKELYEALMKYKEEWDGLPEDQRKTSAVLVNPKTGQRISKAKVHEIVHHYLAYVTTLTKRSPHVLRHSFATAMLNNEANLQAVKDLLGHASLATTEIYTHTTFEELKRMYNQAHPRAK